MVKMKYGEDQPISQSLIKEAGSALGRWMASNRRSHPGWVRRSGGGTEANNLSRDYLGAPPPDEAASLLSKKATGTKLGGSGGGGGSALMTRQKSGGGFLWFGSEGGGGRGGEGGGGGGSLREGVVGRLRSKELLPALFPAQTSLPSSGDGAKRSGGREGGSSPKTSNGGGSSEVAASRRAALMVGGTSFKLPSVR